MDENLVKSSSKTGALVNLLDFIKKFDEINDGYTKIGELHSFIKSFLEHREEIDSDQKHILFVKLISKIPGLLVEILNAKDLTDHSENEIFEKNSRLQASMLCLETILLCLKNTRTIELRLLLLQNSLTILYSSYNHCKDCESLYGDLLEELKDQLANFFNKIQDVQNTMLSEFDELLKNKLHSSLYHLIMPIFTDLYELCELVFNIDATIAKELYKRLVELFESYKEIGQADLKIDSILAALISEISSIGKKFKIIMKNKEQVHVSDSKIFLFKINLTRKIVSIFPGCIKENLQLITRLTLDIYDLLISCYHMAREPSETPLENILIRTIIPVLALFGSENTFISYVLLLNLKDISSDLQIPHLLLKLSTIGILHCKEDQNEMPVKKKIFWNLLSMLQANNPEDDLKFVSVKIPLSLFFHGRRLQADYQPEGASEDSLFSLYHHIYIHLAEFSKKISDTELEELETFLMDMLRSSTSNVVSLLISDVWMYRLRCSSVENLFIRCISFSQKLFRMPSNHPAELLLKRMAKFLPPDYKERLFKHDEQLKAFFSKPNKVLHRYGAPQQKSSSHIKENEVCQKISVLLDELKKPVFNSNQQLVLKACCILELCAVSVDAMNTADFLRITEFATLLFRSGIYKIQIAVLTLLRGLNYKKFNDKDPQFSKVRSNLATLYNEALQSKNYVVRLEAFSLFYAMAQFTDIRITQETIAKFPDLYPDVKAYVSESPQSGFLTEKDKMEMLEKQLSTVTNKPVPSIAITDQSKRILSLLLPT